jgi:predicted nucleic acid-binding Zn ribbon protein
MGQGSCVYCGAAIGTRKRRCCDSCARHASRLWKQRRRAEWRAAGIKYWNDYPPKNLTEWRNKRAARMRRYRAKKGRQTVSAGQEPVNQIEEVRDAGNR